VKPAQPHRLFWGLVPHRRNEGDPEYIEERGISHTSAMTPPPDDPRGRWYSYVEFLGQQKAGWHDEQPNSDHRRRTRPG
jgi:hypothetical protein